MMISVMQKLDSLKTSNKRIVQFYQNNPSLDFEAVNLIFIDLFEKLFGDASATMNTNIHSQILANLNENNHLISELTSEFSTIKSANALPIHSIISSSEDRIHHNINALKDLTNHGQSKLMNDIGELVKKNNQTGFVGNNGTDYENTLVSILSQQYRTAEISGCDVSVHNTIGLIMKRQCKPTIMIYSKNCDSNVGMEETKQFVNCLGEQKCHGVFVSQTSGIACKPNYHIDIHNGYVVLYIHNLNYSVEKLSVAVDVIDTLAVKLKQMSNTHSDITIPKDVLDEINKDFQLFVSQKDTLIQLFKESHKKILSQIEDLRFGALENYLSTKFAPTNMKTGFKCDLCKHFNANNLKALAAHKRGCMRKNAFVIENMVINKENLCL